MIAFLASTRAALVVGLPMPPLGLLLAFALGLGVTLAGAVVPALRASRLSPIAALRPSSHSVMGLSDRLRSLIVAELVVVVAGILLFPIGRTGTPLFPLILSLGLLIGGAVATAFILEPLGRIIGRPFEWIFGAQGLLGRANLARDRVRTGLTVGAMMIALAAVVALGTVAESARGGAERWVASILPGGNAIRSSVPLDVESFRPSFEATPGLQVASPVLEVAGRPGRSEDGAGGGRTWPGSTRTSSRTPARSSSPACRVPMPMRICATVGRSSCPPRSRLGRGSRSGTR